MTQRKTSLSCELRWLLASYLIGWALDLVKREASDETVQAFLALAQAGARDQLGRRGARPREKTP